MFATSKEMAKIVTKQQNDLIFGRKKTLCKSTIAFNSRIVDRYIEFQRYILLFDKSTRVLGLWCLTMMISFKIELFLVAEFKKLFVEIMTHLNGQKIS